MPLKKNPSAATATPKTNDSSARFNYSKDELEKLDKSDLIEALLANQSYTVKILANLEDVNKQLGTLRMKVNDLKTQASASSSSTTDAISDRRMTDLERESFASQQYSRRDSIEIVGIPESIGNEDLEVKTIKLLKAINVDVTASDIQACHHLTKKAV